MNCPQCNVTLAMAERSGVEIDYCPQCRGVWLDRGELDKIVERAGGLSLAAAPQPAVHPQFGRHDARHDARHDGHHDGAHGHGHHKKKSMLSELFDF